MTATTIRRYGIVCANCDSVLEDADGYQLLLAAERQILDAAAEQGWDVAGDLAWCCAAIRRRRTSITVVEHVGVNCDRCGKNFNQFDSLEAAVQEAQEFTEDDDGFWLVMPDGHALCACALPAPLPDPQTTGLMLNKLSGVRLPDEIPGSREATAASDAHAIEQARADAYRLAVRVADRRVRAGQDWSTAYDSATVRLCKAPRPEVKP